MGGCQHRVVATGFIMTSVANGIGLGGTRSVPPPSGLVVGFEGIHGRRLGTRFARGNTILSTVPVFSHNCSLLIGLRGQFMAAQWGCLFRLSEALAEQYGGAGIWVHMTHLSWLRTREFFEEGKAWVWKACVEVRRPRWASGSGI